MGTVGLVLYHVFLLLLIRGGILKIMSQLCKEACLTPHLSVVNHRWNWVIYADGQDQELSYS